MRAIFQSQRHRANNWLFLGSEEDGKAAAIILSLTMTGRRLGLDTHRYFDDVLRKLNTYPCCYPTAKQKASGNITLAPREDRRPKTEDRTRSRPTIDQA